MSIKDTGDSAEALAEEKKHIEKLAEKEAKAIRAREAKAKKVAPKEESDDDVPIAKSRSKKNGVKKEEEQSDEDDIPLAKKGKAALKKAAPKKATAKPKAEPKPKGKAAAKEAKKESSEDGEPEEEEEEEPFDYSKAESVLNKKKVLPHRKDKRQKKDEPFNPYQKSADAPKGMRRLQTERPGKSFTFKK